MRRPPTPPTNDVFLRNLVDWASKELGDRTPDAETRRELYMRSPDGGIWQILVDDLGALSTVKVSNG